MGSGVHAARVADVDGSEAFVGADGSDFDHFTNRFVAIILDIRLFRWIYSENVLFFKF